MLYVRNLHRLCYNMKMPATEPISPAGLLGRQYSGGMGSRGSIRDRASLGGEACLRSAGLKASYRACCANREVLRSCMSCL